MREAQSVALDTTEPSVSQLTSSGHLRRRLGSGVVLVGGVEGGEGGAEDSDLVEGAVEEVAAWGGGPAEKVVVADSEVAGVRRRGGRCARCGLRSVNIDPHPAGADGGHDVVPLAVAV